MLRCSSLRVVAVEGALRAVVFLEPVAVEPEG
jgi:hypothetical protein